MRYIFTIFIIPILFFKITSLSAQVTIEDTRPIDSIFAYTYLLAPVIHNYNVNPTPNGPIMTWDHGNGFYNGNPNLSIGWSNTEDVPHSQAQEINSVQGMAYRSFSLGLMSNIQEYVDSVSIWLISLGIPVGINVTNNLEVKFFPNPTRGHSKLQANIKSGREYKMVLTDLNGRELKQYDGITGDNGLDISISFEGLIPGTYFLIWIIDGTLDVLKVVR